MGAPEATSGPKFQRISWGILPPDSQCTSHCVTCVLIVPPILYETLPVPLNYPSTSVSCSLCPPFCTQGGHNGCWTFCSSTFLSAMICSTSMGHIFYAENTNTDINVYKLEDIRHPHTTLTVLHVTTHYLCFTEVRGVTST